MRSEALQCVDDFGYAKSLGLMHVAGAMTSMTWINVDRQPEIGHAHVSFQPRNVAQALGLLSPEGNRSPQSYYNSMAKMLSTITGITGVQPTANSTRRKPASHFATGCKE